VSFYDEDPTLYCEFEYLFRKMQDFENHKLRKKVKMTPERLAGFIKDEIELLSKEIECT